MKPNRRGVVRTRRAPRQRKPHEQPGAPAPPSARLGSSRARSGGAPQLAGMGRSLDQRHGAAAARGTTAPPRWLTARGSLRGRCPVRSRREARPMPGTAAPAASPSGTRNGAGERFRRAAGAGGAPGGRATAVCTPEHGGRGDTLHRLRVEVPTVHGVQLHESHPEMDIGRREGVTHDVRALPTYVCCASRASNSPRAARSRRRPPATSTCPRAGTPCPLRRPGDVPFAPGRDGGGLELRTARMQLQVVAAFREAAGEIPTDVRGVVPDDAARPAVEQHGAAAGPASSGTGAFVGAAQLLGQGAATAL